MPIRDLGPGSLAVLLGPWGLLLALGLRGLVSLLHETTVVGAVAMRVRLARDKERGGSLVVCQLVRMLILTGRVD